MRWIKWVSNYLNTDGLCHTTYNVCSYTGQQADFFNLTSQCVGVELNVVANSSFSTKVSSCQDPEIKDLLQNKNYHGPDVYQALLTLNFLWQEFKSLSYNPYLNPVTIYQNLLLHAVTDSEFRFLSIKAVLSAKINTLCLN